MLLVNFNWRIRVRCTRPRCALLRAGGINFGDSVKNLPIRQIKIPAKVSGYTVFKNQYNISGLINVDLRLSKLAMSESCQTRPESPG